MKELRQRSEVTNLELFYDLIFAYAISRITTVLHMVRHETIPWLYLLEYAIMFYIFWTVWTYQTVLVNRFFQETVQHSLFMLFDMFLVIVLSQSLSPDFKSTRTIFPAVTSVLLLSISIQYWWRARHLTDVRQLHVAHGLALILFISGGMGMLSIIPWIPYKIQLVVYFSSMVFANISPSLMRHQLTAFPAIFEHLTERYSLFTLLLFGEAIIAVTEMVDVHHFNWLSILFFIEIVALFWIYFTVYQRGVDRHQITAGIVLIDVHYFIFVGLDLIAAVTTLYLKHELIGWQFAGLIGVGLLTFLGGTTAILLTYGSHAANPQNRLKTMGLPCLSILLTLFIWWTSTNEAVTMIILSGSLLIMAWGYWKLIVRRD